MASRASLTLLRNARQGDTAAQLALGRVYLTGEHGLGKSFITAYYWLETAARAGLEEAWMTIGREIPLSALKDTADALQWYRRAAAAGVPQAQRTVGAWLVERAGDDAARAEGLELLRLAGAQGDIAAQELLGTHYLAQPEASADEADARAWLEQAAAQGSDESARRLIALFTAERDLPRLAQYARPLALKGDAPASYALGMALLGMVPAGEASETGSQAVHSTPSPAAPPATPSQAAATEGAQWLLRAAESGLGVAQLEYGRLLLRKESAALIPAHAFSPKRAVFWLSKAAEHGQAEAAYELGQIYRNPAFSQQSAATSTQWVATAARLGHAQAQYEYGAYLWRRRVSLGESTDVEAANWLVKARRLGQPDAAEVLGKIVDSLPIISPELAQARRAASRTAAQVNQLYALRLELAGSFGLRKGEAYFFNPLSGVVDNILVVDVRGDVSKTRRRLFEISDEAQAALLLRMQVVFGAQPAPEGDLAGDYSRRQAQMEAFCKKLGIDEELFFSSKADSKLAA